MLTVQEIAEYLKVNKKTIYRMVSNREIPFVQLGERQIRFDLEEIKKHLIQSTIKPKR